MDCRRVKDQRSGVLACRVAFTDHSLEHPRRSKVGGLHFKLPRNATRGLAGVRFWLA
jgi:hypothetical protein